MNNTGSAKQQRLQDIEGRVTGVVLTLGRIYLLAGVGLGLGPLLVLAKAKSKIVKIRKNFREREEARLAGFDFKDPLF